MKVLITGAAGFIGSALTLRLLEGGDMVIGIDNHNDYYDPSLKEARLARHEGHPGSPICVSTWGAALQWKKLLRFIGRIAQSILAPRLECVIPLKIRWRTFTA